MKTCNGKDCGRPIPVTAGPLCDNCAQKRREASALSAAGSSRRWRAIRRLKLGVDAMCEVEDCPQLGTVVDHWVDRVVGGTDEDSNLITMCASHHKRKHLGESFRLRQRSLRGVSFA